MDTEDKNWAILRARFSHGTAQQVSIPSVVPVDKQAKEKFWVEALALLVVMMLF